MGAGVFLMPLPVSGTLFLLLGALSSLDRKDFVLSYSILLCPPWLLSLGDLLFPEEEIEREWIWGGVGWGELRGVERREIVVRVYCM